MDSYQEKLSQLKNSLIGHTHYLVEYHRKSDHKGHPHMRRLLANDAEVAQQIFDEYFVKSTLRQNSEDFLEKLSKVERRIGIYLGNNEELPNELFLESPETLSTTLLDEHKESLRLLEDYTENPELLKKISQDQLALIISVCAYGWYQALSIHFDRHKNTNLKEYAKSHKATLTTILADHFEKIEHYRPENLQNLIIILAKKSLICIQMTHLYQASQKQHPTQINNFLFRASTDMKFFQSLRYLLECLKDEPHYTYEKQTGPSEKIHFIDQPLNEIERLIRSKVAEEESLRLEILEAQLQQKASALQEQQDRLNDWESVILETQLRCQEQLQRLYQWSQEELEKKKEEHECLLARIQGTYDYEMLEALFKRFPCLTVQGNNIPPTSNTTNLQEPTFFISPKPSQSSLPRENTPLPSPKTL